MADEAPGRQFTTEEAEEILRRALQRQTEVGISREDLVAAARDVGVSEQALLEAADEVERGRSEKAVTERLKAEKRAGFVSHATAYAVVGVGLFLLNLATNLATVTDQVPRWWSLFPLVGWGIAVAIHAVRALRHPEPDPAEVREEVERLALEARARADEDARQARLSELDAQAMLTRLGSLLHHAQAPRDDVRVRVDEGGAAKPVAAAAAQPATPDDATAPAPDEEAHARHE